MGHHTLKGVVCDMPSILGMFRIENKMGYYHRLKSAVFNSDIKNALSSPTLKSIIFILIQIYRAIRNQHQQPS